MDNETAKALGCLFLAIVHSLTDEHRAEIAGTIIRAANNPGHSAELREYFKFIHHVATADPDQLALEVECCENGGRPRLSIVTGGDAA